MSKYAPDPEDIKKIKRIDSLFNTQERTQKECVWGDLTEFLLPNQSGIFNNTRASEQAGTKKTTRLYTSFPIDQAQKLTSALSSILTNQAQVWSKYRDQRNAVNEDPQVSEFLDATNVIIFNLLNDSNFYTEVSKAYQQWVVLGNMVIFHEEKDPIVGSRKYPGFKFTALHLSQVTWISNKDGYVDRVAYRFELSAEQAIEKYGKENVSDKIKVTAESHPDQKFQFYLWIAPRDKSKISLEDESSPEERAYEAITYEVDSKCKVKEDGYYEFPMYCTRWDLLPGEDFGRSRAELALPDIKSMNKLAKNHMIASDKDVNPPYLVNQRDFFGGEIRQTPGSQTVVKDVNGYKELVSMARTDRVMDLYNEYKSNIASLFFIDQILLPPRQDIGQMREAEVLQRIKEKHTVFGPVVPRAYAEFLIPLMNRSFKMALRAGVLPPVPDTLKKEGLLTDITFMNELSAAQKMTTVQTNLSFVQQVAYLASLSPDALDNLDFDTLVKIDHAAMGVDQAVLKDPQDVQAVREGRAKQQAAQAALQAQNLAADTQAKSSSANASQSVNSNPAFNG